jgi:hypothetical protein
MRVAPQDRPRLGNQTLPVYIVNFLKFNLRPLGRNDSIQAVCRRMRRLDGFLYEAPNSKNSRSNIKNQKPIAVDGTTFMQI